MLPCDRHAALKFLRHWANIPRVLIATSNIVRIARDNGSHSLASAERQQLSLMLGAQAGCTFGL